MKQMIELIKGLIGMAKSSPYKLAIILAIVSAVSGFIIYQQKIQYDRGYDAARVEMFEKFQDDLETSTKNAKKDLGIAIENRDKFKQIAINLQKELNKKPKVLPGDIITVVEKMPCDSLGHDGYQLWLDITSKPIQIH